MNNSPQQSHEECKDFLPPIEAVIMEGLVNGEPFKIIIAVTRIKVMSSVSVCINKNNLCENEYR